MGGEVLRIVPGHRRLVPAQRPWTSPARSSRKRLSSKYRPMAFTPMAWIGYVTPSQLDGTASPCGAGGRPGGTDRPAAGQVRSPRAATVHTVSTRSPRKPMISLVRLAQVQAWNG